MNFGYNQTAQPEASAATIEPVKEVTKVEPPLPRKKLGIGKTNRTKSIKVPTVIHSEIHLLGSFMDEAFHRDK